MKITKLVVDKFPIPQSAKAGQTAQKRYYDEILKGFGVRVTSGGTKAFFVEKLVHHKLRRVTLGRYPEITVEQARKEAQKMLGQIATGIDPLAQRKQEKVQVVTLEETFLHYVTTRKGLKPKTLYDYQRVLQQACADWLKKPLLDITKDKVAKKHSYLGEKHGEAYANLAMRLLRALFNFAAGHYEDAKGHSLITENPVKRLSQTRAWYRVERRQNYIKAHQLAVWYQGISQLRNETLKDYLLLILFTGLRRQEAAQLQWQQVDLKAKTLQILDTKNHQPHTLPLSDYLCELFQKRKATAQTDYVFPGEGKGGYIIEPRRQIAHVVKAIGFHFTLHDLRRTFITIAESLDISAYAVKRLVNHKMNSDVTAGYIVTDIERLREPMERISEFLVKAMEIQSL